jgi:diguanylate cyclase (GGDEF)-like protein
MLAEHRYILRQWGHFLMAVVFVLATGLLDNEFGEDVHLFVLHLVPIGFITWHYGRSAGAMISGFSALVWLLSAESLTHTEHRIALYWNLLTEVLMFFGLNLTLAKLRDALDEARKASETDALTGVANRRALVRHATQELKRAQRYKTPLTVVFLDLDNFKEVNDTHGHPTGDACLTLVAQTLQLTVRRVDCIARLGGDEFAVLLPDTTKEAASLVIKKLQRAINDGMARYQWPVTCSIGAITHTRPDPKLTVDDLLREADMAMYKAKVAGKNRVQISVTDSAAVLN